MMIFESKKMVGLVAVGLVAGTSLAGCSSEVSDPPKSPTSPSVSIPSESESGSPTASATEVGGVTAVVSPAPENAEQAEAKAFEAVQAHYDVVNEVIVSKQLDEEGLAATTTDPLYGQLVEGLAPLEDSSNTSNGGSVPRLLEAIPGKLIVDDTEYPYASVGVSVCEDNTQVRVTDENGDPVSSGDVLRYEIDYAVQWNPSDETWRVSRMEVPRDSEGEARQC